MLTIRYLRKHIFLQKFFATFRQQKKMLEAVCSEKNLKNYRALNFKNLSLSNYFNNNLTNFCL